MSGSDQTLVARAQRGERAAFQMLLERHYAAMFRIAYRFMGQMQDAEDIAQDICVGLADKLATFRGDSSFSTWLYRIVVNACRDRQKRQSLHQGLNRRYLELEAAHRSEGREADRQAARLYRAIGGLDEPLKETALLLLAKEVSHAEAGRILGCAESTISWRMLEVRKRLKQAMDQDHD